MTTPITPTPPAAAAVEIKAETKAASGELEFHPIANIFPMMEDKELDRLKADILTRGLQEQIVIYEGKVLDGRNRYKACKELNLTPATKPYEGDDRVGLVVSANLHRRHLSESQRAMVAAKLVTTKLGDNQHIRKEGRPIDQPSAAKMLNVSAKSVQRAKEVCDKTAPNIQALVESGKLPVSVAVEVAKLPREKQAELKTASNIREATKQPAAGSDQVDKLVKHLIVKLREMRSKDPANAAAAVAALVRELRIAGLWTEQKKQAA